MNHRTSDVVIGIHVASHDSAACLIRDGMIIAAEEERFSRQKHHSGFPHAALEYCLNRAGVELRQVDSILITYSPTRLIGTAVRHTLSWNSDLSPTNRIRYIGDELKILSQNLGAWLNCVRISPSTLKGINFCEHHIAHAAGAFLQSEFSQAAVLSVDGYGDSDSATISLADELGIRILARVRFPASLGLLYNATTAYLGFRPDCDEGKIMALSAYGQPRFADLFSQIVREDRPMFDSESNYFDFSAQRFSGRVRPLIGGPRKFGEPILDRHIDIAASVQRVTERLMLRLAKSARELTGASHLCLTGGVAQNVLANGMIAQSSGFDRIFVHPASCDSGTAMGAASYQSYYVRGRPRPTLKSPFIGPDFDEGQIVQALRDTTVSYTRPVALASEVAELLQDGHVVGWFQGGLEFGPRALGGRNILASPRSPDMRDFLNSTIKKRDSFRPYGVAVLHEFGEEVFDEYTWYPYMNVALRVRDEWRPRIPSAVHVDGTCRVQSVRQDDHAHPLSQLLTEFGRRSGFPILLSTSFNGPGEPIVCTPADALASFEHSGLRFLAIGPFLVERGDERSSPTDLKD
ncbi:carbamoyltransferase [Streptomyces sp. NPDC048179]|uniref:carbamoyltransferase family protein n=1 Tax=Streptomyces sp. NPDC048179 TaxID=3365506 RepID=UPI003720657D